MNNYFIVIDERDFNKIETALKRVDKNSNQKVWAFSEKDNKQYSKIALEECTYLRKKYNHQKTILKKIKKYFYSLIDGVWITKIPLEYRLYYREEKSYKKIVDPKRSPAINSVLCVLNRAFSEACQSVFNAAFHPLRANQDSAEFAP